MNVQTAIGQRAPLKLKVESFLLLRQAGAFGHYSKSELLDGELWGVLLQPDDEPETDAEYPIKLTRDHYALLDRSGAFAACRKTELVDGWVYEMSPQYRPHGFVKDELAYRLRRAIEAVGTGLHVATEQSVAIDPHSEPQPDIILTTEPRGLGAIPAGSVALVVEVSDSTTRFDLGDKMVVYALAGIREYWVADVTARVMHQMWAPTGEDYAERRELTFGERIAAVTVEGLAVETTGL